LIRFMVSQNTLSGFGYSGLTDEVGFSYISADCSGTPFLPSPTADERSAYFLGVDTHSGRTDSSGHTEVVYPLDFGTVLAMHSHEPGPSGSYTSQAVCDAQVGMASTFVPPNRCCVEQTNVVDSFAPIAVIDSEGASLGLLPPFHLEGP